ncbi:hypothetical protein PL11_000030 [Lentilactobacillus curieae]|uniref:Uncharacterized protein n=1 Tax=Lentilactobacillus curieae TaxID=1138822 RepID=A0A1S6QFR5_9LACO|nr:hypothetical protein [Lentilactobacillus curieae]AQW20450.1 hypothetical protein PL11_000030 [Lentilactobacillus curieae]
MKTINGFNILSLIVISLGLLGSCFFISADIWFSNMGYYTGPDTWYGHPQWLLQNVTFFIVIVCVATLWIKKSNAVVIIIAMIIAMLLVFNLSLPIDVSAYIWPAIIIPGLIGLYTIVHVVIKGV